MSADLSQLLVTSTCSISEAGEAIGELRSSSDQITPLASELLFEGEPKNEPLVSTWAAYERHFRRRRFPTKAGVWRIPNCIILPPHMLLVTSDGRLIQDTVRKRPLASGHPNLGHLYQEAEPVKIAYRSRSERVFALGSGQMRNYYHFMVEFLPKLAWSPGIAANGLGLAVPPRAMPFLSHALDLYLGVKSQRIVVRQPTLFPEVVFIQNMVSSSIRLSPLINDFYRFARPYSNRRTRRLMMTRFDAKTRRLVNAEEMAPLLAANGFEVVTPGALPLQEQARLFSEAEIVLGPHGAGLANLVFCHPGTHVIELLPDSFNQGFTCYAALSEILSHRYTGLLTTALEPQRGGKSNLTLSAASVDAILSRTVQ